MMYREDYYEEDSDKKGVTESSFVSTETANGSHRTDVRKRKNEVLGYRAETHDAVA